MGKKAIDLNGLESGIQRHLENVDEKNRIHSRGIFGDKLVEPVPNYISTPSEKVINNSNNSWIVLGRDRMGSRLSGYGAKGDTHAASLDLVVGRLGSDARKVDNKGSQLWVDPNPMKDAARIYISQKTDADANFGLADGSVGDSKARSAVVVKADGVRIVAREGIKLVTGTDKKNSQGGSVRAISGINLIAGNDDTNLQPISLGNNLEDAMTRIVHHMDELSGIVDAMLMSQMEMNQAITQHYHISPFFAIPTTPAIDVLVPKGIKCLIEQLTKVKRSLVSFKINLANFKLTYLNPIGKKYINSRYNKTN